MAKIVEVVNYPDASDYRQEISSHRVTLCKNRSCTSIGDNRAALDAHVIKVVTDGGKKYRGLYLYITQLCSVCKQRSTIMNIDEASLVRMNIDEALLLTKWGFAPILKENCMNKTEIESLLKDYTLTQSIDFDVLPEINPALETFHPGESFVIAVDDDYIAGIRCNHLVVIKGYTEVEWRESILLLGNHKGTLIIKLFVKK